MTTPHGNNDGPLHDDFFLAMLLGSSMDQRRLQEEQTEYQRQELNLLRRHQGLPPIPPPQPSPRRRLTPDRLIVWFFIAWIGLALLLWMWPT